MAGISKRQLDDFEWYRDNLLGLFLEYGDRYVAIKNRTVLGAYDSMGEAIDVTSAHHSLGTFIVERLGIDERAYTVEAPWIRC